MLDYKTDLHLRSEDPVGINPCVEVDANVTIVFNRFNGVVTCNLHDFVRWYLYIQTTTGRLLRP